MSYILKEGNESERSEMGIKGEGEELEGKGIMG
jgi:hypothetical protein